MKKRLVKISELIADGRGMIDVGTDHGYLPVHLAKRGYSGRIFASDIHDAPLASARKTAREAAVEDRISFLCCDGLAQCPPDEIDTIVIAGMGGDTICGILDRAEWCLDEAYTLILQPMTKAEVLRYWLVNNGFTLTEEHLVREGGFLYQIIKARCIGNMHLSDAELYAGALDNLCGEEHAGEWLGSLLLRFEKEERGLLSSEKRNEGRLSVCRSVRDGLRKMKGELA